MQALVIKLFKVAKNNQIHKKFSYLKKKYMFASLEFLIFNKMFWILKLYIKST